MMPMHSKKTAKEILSDNLRLLFGGNDSQKAREELSKKSGVSPRTIGNMISRSSGNPTLANLEAVALAKGYSVADLLTENLGKDGTRTPCVPPKSNSPSVSPAASRLIERLIEAEAAGTSSPGLVKVLNDMMNLVIPEASASDYSALKNAIENDD